MSFKEDFIKKNSKNTKILNLNSMRIGINSLVSLSNILSYRKIDKLNLADNSITDYGMHPLKTIIQKAE